MANLETASATTFTAAEPGRIPGLLVSLAALPHEALETILTNLALAFPDQSLTVVYPDSTPTNSEVSDAIRLIAYTPPVVSTTNWILTATDYLNTFKLAREHQATTCLLLGAEARSLHPGALRELALAATRNDLAMASYDIGPREGLINSAILYPVTRAIYGARPRFPLALDLGLSIRMAERLANAAQKFTAVNQDDALLWPVAEAAAANFTINEVMAGARTLPQPNGLDLNSLLALLAGSLFADVDLKASYWQRARATQSPRQLPSAAAGATMPDVQPMLDSFRRAYTNLHEIWSLVLPPHSLLGLKKLSLMPPAEFFMPDALWARIVYDFILAWRLRTINRGHLLGALTPLYLAWVASHILLAHGGTALEAHVEAQAAAFEADKPYLVSRWRWPDRFNP
ncbi:MAG: hypothetical protein ABI197_10615 [Granulicella sp.]